MERNKFLFLIILIVIVISLASIYLSSQFGITGNIVSDIGNNQTVITKDDAINLLSESETIIQDMETNGFGTNYVKDLLIEEKKSFEQAKYAEILRNSSSNESDLKEASEALRLVNWRNINYNLMIPYYDKIKQARDKSIDLTDSIYLLDTKLQDYNSQGIQFSPQDLDPLNEAKKALQEERYSDAEKLIIQARDSIESGKIETSRISALSSGILEFIKNNWIYIVVSLIVLFLFLLYILRISRIKMIKNKILRMKAEKTALIELEKKTQVERFKENKISGVVYNVRMRKYKEKLQEIKEELPILEKKLKNKS